MPVVSTPTCPCSTTFTGVWLGVEGRWMLFDVGDVGVLPCVSAGKADAASCRIL